MTILSHRALDLFAAADEPTTGFGNALLLDREWNYLADPANGLLAARPQENGTGGMQIG